ncbi:hypothetical protein [Actinacidiphila oryziradicis]|uniref:hypothetical protein n=1 Tax=Actinacidiphila oryziradicis TaxID=2571141 RepID=UPI00145F48E4|nr:hypothetical protein [Actinacidiphila oryziradicis]
MLLAEPQVVAVVSVTGDAVGFDQRAVEDHVGHVLASAAVQDRVQVGGLIGEDVDAFVQVAVAGGRGDAGVAGQAVPTSALAEPAQDQYGLAERAESAAAARRADPSPVGGQQAEQVVHNMALDVERGNIGDQRETSGTYGHDLVVRPFLPGALRLSAAGPSSSGLLARGVVHTGSRRSFRRENASEACRKLSHCAYRRRSQWLTVHVRSCQPSCPLQLNQLTITQLFPCLVEDNALPVHQRATVDT